jgi:hypothetical protein
MKVLVACEFSGVVRDCFRNRGHDAWSCDLLPTESDPAYHMQDNVLDHLEEGWDLMIAHPPCVHLAVSGARWFRDRKEEQRKAIDFFMSLVDAPIPRTAVENPKCIMSTLYRKPDQIVQPWQFGHGEVKMTCLWLKNLPKLEPTCIVDGRSDRVLKEPDSKNRWRKRSRTYQGIAEAMADQWGCLI